MLSHLSDPLRRKVYEPKIVVQECSKDESITATSDKISQLSLSFRKELVLTTKDGDSVNGIDNEEITLCTFETSQVRKQFYIRILNQYHSYNEQYVNSKL